jgi:hypothetical protein
VSEVATRDDVSPSERQVHLAKGYAWSDELARQGRHNAATVGGRDRVVIDGPSPESKDLVTGSVAVRPVEDHRS